MEGEYLLFVGNRMLHRNLEELLEGFRLLRERHPLVRLVVAGWRVKREDPRDPGSITAGLERVLRDGRLLETLVREGHLLAGKLGKEDPVGTLLSAYAVAASGKKRERG